MTAEDLVDEFEGCELTAYLDLGGIPTIGRGHTGKDVYLGLIWTQAQAEEACEHDLLIARLLLNQYSPNIQPPSNAEPLVDFCFNLGIGNYRTSTLCRAVNAQDWPEAKIQLLSWDHSGGKVIPGLLRRRQAEAALITA